MADEQSKKTVKKAMKKLPSKSRSVRNRSNRRMARSDPAKERALDEQNELLSDVEETTSWASRNQATIREYELAIRQAEEEQLIADTLMGIEEVLHKANIRQKAQDPNAPPITLDTLMRPYDNTTKKTSRKRFTNLRRQQVPNSEVPPVGLFQKFMDFGKLSPGAEAWKAAKASGNEKNFRPPPPQKMYVDPISKLRTSTPYREVDFDLLLRDPDLLQPTIKKTREEQLADIQREVDLFIQQMEEKKAKESETSGNVCEETMFNQKEVEASGNEVEKVLPERINVKTDLKLDSDGSDGLSIEDTLKDLKLSPEVSKESKPKSTKSKKLNNIIGKLEKRAEEKSQEEILNHNKNDGACTSKQVEINKNSSDESSKDSDINPRPKSTRKKKSRKSKANIKRIVDVAGLPSNTEEEKRIASENPNAPKHIAPKKPFTAKKSSSTGNASDGNTSKQN